MERGFGYGFSNLDMSIWFVPILYIKDTNRIHDFINYIYLIEIILLNLNFN